ncbi:MAG: tripartite tricarboxylate transporter substrate binding protein [Pigmentiphaga sp.]|uniref:tripartite tricarboxylate transporter substrate binding protein n=1 Tax=Pigmentiphaga sp. TaxID=1977564 RepID=UPI0029A57E29|nr:tripartite tricarboxylate transporter substrate binding protein [Pigmentiphaga sp.]MDX3906204.1 tripartite tricarboxylate transporter substrate binding protein [Pigmentiphaga sp.]
MAAASQAHAADYPVRPIRLVVPFPPGGSADVLARLISQNLSGQMGQPVIVENKPGAGTAIGAKFVAATPPDGYTLLLGTVSSHAMNPAMSDVGYDPVASFTPIARLVSIPFVVLAHPSVPAGNINELLALARARPGILSYSSAGNGTSNHLAGALLANLSHVDLLHVPYKGSAPALNDLLAGQVNLMFDLQLTAMPHIKDGRVKALAITSDKRSALLPDLPTVAESGVPGYEASAWFGIFGPAGMPGPVVDQLNAELARLLAKPEVKAQLAKLGAEPVPDTPAHFASYVQNEAVKWAKVVRTAGLAAKD